LLRRFAEVNGHSLQELLGDLMCRSINIDIAVKLVERGISFDDYQHNPDLLNEELPDGVVNIFDAYRARDEAVVMGRNVSGVEEIVAKELVPGQYSFKSRKSIFGMVAVAAMCVLSPFYGSSPSEKEEVTKSVYRNVACVEIEGELACNDKDAFGQSFGSYWDNRLNRK